MRTRPQSQSRSISTASLSSTSGDVFTAVSGQRCSKTANSIFPSRRITIPIAALGAYPKIIRSRSLAPHPGKSSARVIRWQWSKKIPLSANTLRSFNPAAVSDSLTLDWLKIKNTSVIYTSNQNGKVQMLRYHFSGETNRKNKNPFTPWLLRTSTASIHLSLQPGPTLQTASWKSRWTK